MVRPSLSSLNSLAEVLRQAQPLYSACHSIISNLGNKGTRTTSPTPASLPTTSDHAWFSPTKDPIVSPFHNTRLILTTELPQSERGSQSDQLRRSGGSLERAEPVLLLGAPGTDRVISPSAWRWPPTLNAKECFRP
jgi:hypothetical protein